MKKILLPLAAVAAFTASTQAAVIFNGSSDTVLMAADASMTLGNPSTGTWTLASGAAAQGGYIFGNFASTTLSNVGDSITLSFTTTNWPGATSPGDQVSPLAFSLSGGGTLVTTNTTRTAFTNYDGFISTKNLGGTPYTARATSNTNNLADTSTGTALTGGTTLGGADLFNYGKTADFSLTISRTATAFDVNGTINVVGGTGLQSLSLGSFTPGTGFQLGDSFTTFAIGIAGTSAASQMNSGTMTFSNISVNHTVIPEPSTWALLAGGLTSLVIFRRRRNP